jgi:hypothetical protein
MRLIGSFVKIKCRYRYCVMSRIATLIVFSVLSLPLPVLAAYPDRETDEFVQRRYNLFLQATREGCTWYANPKSARMYSDKSAPLNSYGKRSVSVSVSVLQVRGEGGGTACNGVFEFLAVTAECESGYISWSRHIGSIPSWEVFRDNNYPQTASKICSLIHPEGE